VTNRKEYIRDFWKITGLKGDLWPGATGRKRTLFRLQNEKLLKFGYMEEKLYPGDYPLYWFGFDKEDLNASFFVFCCGPSERYLVIPRKLVEKEKRLNEKGRYLVNITASGNHFRFTGPSSESLDRWLNNFSILHGDAPDQSARDSHSDVETNETLSPEREREIAATPVATSEDSRPSYSFPTDNDSTERIPTVIYRILRDSTLSREIKQLYNYMCQLCGFSITLSDGTKYAEMHHVRPLGGGHNGSDTWDNVMCLCPNCHVQLDYGCKPLLTESIRWCQGHLISPENLEYHNKVIYTRRNDI
jgi:hypothetical protein